MPEAYKSTTQADLGHTPKATFCVILIRNIPSGKSREKKQLVVSREWGEWQLMTTIFVLELIKMFRNIIAQLGGCPQLLSCTP